VDQQKLVQPTQPQQSPSKTLPKGRRSSSKDKDQTLTKEPSGGKHKSSKKDKERDKDSNLYTPEKDKERSKIPTRTVSVDTKHSYSFRGINQEIRGKKNLFSKREVINIHFYSPYIMSLF
jgi:hypothetical protein